MNLASARGRHLRGDGLERLDWSLGLRCVARLPHRFDPREDVGVVALDLGADAPFGGVGGDNVGQLGFARGGLRVHGLACRGTLFRLEVLQRAQLCGWPGERIWHEVSSEQSHQ